MARYIYQGSWKDGNGRVVTSGTVSVFLAGTSTAASVYAAEVGGGAVNSVTSDSTDGSFSFWVDDSDYGPTQRFKITLSKTNFQSKTYDDLIILPDPASAVYFTTVGYTDKSVEDLVDAGYDLDLKPGTIFGGANNTAGHTVPDVADDTFTLNDAAQTLTNKTLTTPTVNSPVLTTPQINDTSSDHQYVVAPSELAADRTVTLPLLTGNDTFMFFTFHMKDEDDMASDSATHGATQQSIKAYTDAHGLVQSVSTETGAVNTGTTVMPLDDTIPQNTEGNEYMTLSITPTNAANDLEITTTIHLSHTAASGSFVVGLFQDTTAGALAATIEDYLNNLSVSSISFTHTMTAGTTSATTFKIRAGASVAGTTTFNGSSGARLMGGVLSSSITIKEIQV